MNNGIGNNGLVNNYGIGLGDLGRQSAEFQQQQERMRQEQEMRLAEMRRQEEANRQQYQGVGLDGGGNSGASFGSFASNASSSLLDSGFSGFGGASGGGPTGGLYGNVATTGLAGGSTTGGGAAGGLYGNVATTGLAGGSAAGGGGGSAAAGGGSALAAAGPWAALAAAILINEREAKEHGYRAEDDSEYAKDLATGKVLYQDVDQRWADKLFGSDDKYGLGGDMRAAAAAGGLDFKKSWKHLKDDSSIAKVLKKIF